ncbi:MAG: type II CAAX prenyl endopeptidase Rce1 family protein [Synechococcaceae cyanobacterium]
MAAPGAPSGDWVWIQLEQAPAGWESWIGRQRRLRWADRPELRRLVEAVTTDIHLGAKARLVQQQGNGVPQRLDGRQRVGPLQSLAGARRRDDVIVRLEGVSPEGEELRIDRPPLQISGRWQGLVSVLGPALGEKGDGAQRQEPGLWRVRHYDRASGRFAGPLETIRIPVLPPDGNGRLRFDPAGLASSPLNHQGWLIQGAPGPDGVFTVQAIEPRRLLQPESQRQVQGTRAGLAFLKRGVWNPQTLQRGSLGSTALLPDGLGGLSWQPGDRALLLHLFGGIGGPNGEPHPPWTVTGHFAFGEARVVRDPFSDQPRLAIRYHQIYANNPDGIVAGSQDWSAFAGNLERGWLGLRPFSDLLVPMGPQVLDAIALQTEILAARYRSGDGEGVAMVTAATSCVQDSSQALWIAIQQLRQSGALLAMNPQERQWLQRLGTALENLLTPMGRVRSDWAHNSSLALDQTRGHFQASQSWPDVLRSWRSLLPRGAQDAMAAELLRAGLPLLVLRTNQIPGHDPRLAPQAPTTLLGQLPVVSTLLARLGESLLAPPLAMGPGWPLAVLVGYAILALGLGWRLGFLPRRWRWPPWPQLLARGAGYLLMPAFVEELLFRGLLLPNSVAGVEPAAMVGWVGLSVGLFVLYHPLAGRLWYPQGRLLFETPAFLIECGLLGLACSLAYGLSGSLWWAVLLHWLAVLLWLEPLQGRQRLVPKPPGP